MVIVYDVSEIVQACPQEMDSDKLSMLQDLGSRSSSERTSQEWFLHSEKYDCTITAIEKLKFGNATERNAR